MSAATGRRLWRIVDRMMPLAMILAGAVAVGFAAACMASVIN